MKNANHAYVNGGHNDSSDTVRTQESEENMKKLLPVPKIETRVTILRSLSEHLNRITSILVVASAICCLSTVVMTIILFQPNSSQPSSVSPEQPLLPEICVQCIKLIRNQFNQQEEDPLVNKLSKRLDNGVQMCCAQNSEQMSAILEAILREQVSSPKLSPVSRSQTVNLNLRFTPVSVHKHLLPVDESELSLEEPLFNDGLEHFLATFNKDFNDPLTEHVRGVQVLDTALKINYTGLYYVYVSVHMGPKFDKQAKSFRYQNWFQYVHRTSPNSPENSGVLLQTSYTADDQSINDQETAFAGGTFYLTKGDLIEVCLSGQGLVQYKKESTFVGLFMLESGPRREETDF